MKWSKSWLKQSKRSSIKKTKFQINPNSNNSESIKRKKNFKKKTWLRLCSAALRSSGLGLRAAWRTTARLGRSIYPKTNTACSLARSLGSKQKKLRKNSKTISELSNQKKIKKRRSRMIRNPKKETKKKNKNEFEQSERVN